MGVRIVRGPADVTEDDDRLLAAAPTRHVRWNLVLVTFMRIVALLWIAKGLIAWAAILGVAGAVPFEARLPGHQATTVYFAVIDLVAGVEISVQRAFRVDDQLGEVNPGGHVVHLFQNMVVRSRGERVTVLVPCTPRMTVDGLETTFAVNVLAAHLLTHLLAADLGSRLLWLGSGMARSGRPDPATLGRAQEASRAYADSKACDVALALAWGRRLPTVASAAVDPGWVKTKLASAGAPGDVRSSADTLAYCCTEADLASAAYWRNRAPTPVPHHLRDEALQDAIASACDRLAGIS